MRIEIFPIAGKLKRVMKKIKQIYHPYWNWECFHAGMYATKSDIDMDTGREMYRQFLSNLDRFIASMYWVILSWPVSCEQFLTNPSINRIAWLGQASMCIDNGLPRKYKSGFMLLTYEQQNAANNAAEKVLIEWIELQSTLKLGN